MDKQALLGSLHSQITDLQKMVKDMAQSGSIHQLDKDMFKNKIIILYEDALKLQKIDNILAHEEQKRVHIPPPTVAPESVTDTKTPEPPVMTTPKEVKKVIIPKPEPVPEPLPEPLPEPAPLARHEPKPEPIPEPAREPEPVKAEPKVQNPSPLGDRMKPQKEAVNEIYGKAKSSTKATANPQPISDILIAIGLNDRFQFTRELFGNNSELFKSTVSKLNNMPNFDEASSYLSTEFDWDKEDSTTESFLQIVKRRFL